MASLSATSHPEVEQERRRWELPWPKRPYPLETRQSYFLRLMRANYIPREKLRFIAANVAKRFPDFADRAPELTLEMLAGLPIGLLDEAAYAPPALCTDAKCRCGEGVAYDRFRCIQCSKGQSVPLHPNLEPFVCAKHRRWVGPGAQGDAQVALRAIPAMVRAAQLHRRLLTAGRFDPLRFRGIWQLLAESYRDGLWLPAVVASPHHPRLPHQRAEIAAYPSAIHAAAALEDPSVLTALLDPRRTRGEVEDLLGAVVQEVSGPGDVSFLVRRLRYLLRPDFFRVAKATTQGWHESPVSKYPIPKVALHDRDLSALRYSQWPRQRTGVPPGFPGFDQPSSPLYIDEHERRDYRHEFWHERRGRIWGDDGLASRQSEWICVAGHQIRAAHLSRSSSKRNGCKYCSGKFAVPGVTDIATTHPAGFAYWDHSRNVGLPYWEQTAGRSRPANWCCPAGHTWERGISVFLKNSHCKQCEVPNRRMVNLQREFPELVAWWDTKGNTGLDPGWLAMYVDVARWNCPKGHSFPSTLNDIVRHDYHCPVCTHRRLVPGVNDLQTVRPDLAHEFAVSLNGGLTAAKIWPHSPTQRKWICPNGHVYKRSPRERVDLGIGCTKCTGRTVISGETDLATVKPDVAARWDQVRNGALTPDNVHPGSPHLAFFTCLCGNPWKTEIRYMRADRYCKGCTTRLRAARR